MLGTHDDYPTHRHWEGGGSPSEWHAGHISSGPHKDNQTHEAQTARMIYTGSEDVILDSQVLGPHGDILDKHALHPQKDILDKHVLHPRNDILDKHALHPRNDILVYSAQH